MSSEVANKKKELELIILTAEKLIASLKLDIDDCKKVIKDAKRDLKFLG